MAPVSSCQIETARFDTQKLENPEIRGTGYQQGTLAGYELREYLLEKWERKCAYCGRVGVPLEIEHIVVRSRGGSNRAGNLTLSCRPCNETKGRMEAREFLKGRPERLARLLAQAKAPLRDAAAVNVTRYAVGDAIKGMGLPTSFWSGGRTKFNRSSQGYPKAHRIDAARVGESGGAVRLACTCEPLRIKAMGRGTRQVVRTERYGFPRSAPGRVKRVEGFQTGDLVRLTQPRGKYAGSRTGRLAGVRADRRFDISAPGGKITAMSRNYRLLQRGDGYAYA